MLCEYGCSQEAKYFLKRAKKWCCSKSYNSCPVNREKNRKSHLGEKNHRYGKSTTDKTKKKISEANKGNIPWNKGKRNIYTIETREKMGLARKGKIPWNKGLTNYYVVSKETKEKIRKSSIGRKHSEKTKQKLSSIFKGRIVSKRTKRLMSINHPDISGTKNPNWKGGYDSSGIPRYDNFVNILTIEEKPERDIIDGNILTVLCSYCGKRFIPSLVAVKERVRSLNGTNYGENRLYCSEKCKNDCPVFRKKIYSNNHPRQKTYTEEEYQTFREAVLERDNYKCQYCGELAEYVHHERPQKLEPFFALDPDLAWSVCKKCHYKYGHKDECSTGKLANKIC